MSASGEGPFMGPPLVPPAKGKAVDGKRRLNTSRTSEKERKAKLVQTVCVSLNPGEQGDVVKTLYHQATDSLNKRQGQESTILGEETYRDRIRTKVKKQGRKGDTRKFDEAMLTLKTAAESRKVPACLHFLSELSFSETTAQPPVAQLMQQVCQLADTMQNAAQQPNSSTSSLAPSASKSTLKSTASVASSLSTSTANASVKSTGMPLSAATSEPSTSVPLGSALSIATNNVEPPLPFGGVAGHPVEESTLVQDLIFSFQGVDGHILKFNAIAQEYQLDPKAVVPARLRLSTLRQSQLSLMHRGVASASEAGQGGVVAQALAAAFRCQLTEFYRLLAGCQAELSTSGLTLRMLALRTREASQRMRWLHSIALATTSLRGGAILSRVHGFLEHGAGEVRQIVLELLAAACLPVLHMLSRWLLDGELSDPFQEFFIAGNAVISGDRLWHEKYRVQESMVPSFIPMELADKILATGKSINFLREVCRDRVDLQGRAALKAALADTPVEALFAWDSGAGGDLRRMMETAFRETSSRVIAVLTEEFRLMEHLQALRDFLLLGQGDFIGHLMELLEPELVRPGSELLPHNVSALLDVAVRTTNAQFAPPDVLARLDVRVLNASPGDAGWDIFTLDYHVLGPVGTVFASTMTSYLVLFQALWKAKRIEWVLSRMWKQQATGSKMLRKIPELAPVLRQVHLLTSEMIHFVHQMQYYVLFEVIECSWAELAVQVRDAATLDDIIRAHHDFLGKVKAGALLDPGTRDLAVQLRAMFETVLQLQTQVDLLHTRALQELDNRARLNALIEERGRQGEFGLSSKEEAEFAAATHSFLGRLLPGVRIQVKSLAASYQNCVRKLLQMLSDTGLVSLQLLSFRLDFNEHYKRNAVQRRAANK